MLRHKPSQAPEGAGTWRDERISAHRPDPGLMPPAGSLEAGQLPRDLLLLVFSFLVRLGLGCQPKLRGCTYGASASGLCHLRLASAGSSASVTLSSWPSWGSCAESPGGVQEPAALVSRAALVSKAWLDVATSGAAWTRRLLGPPGQPLPPKLAHALLRHCTAAHPWPLLWAKLMQPSNLLQSLGSLPLGRLSPLRSTGAPRSARPDLLLAWTQAQLPERCPAQDLGPSASTAGRAGS